MDSPIFCKYCQSELDRSKVEQRLYCSSCEQVCDPEDDSEVTRMYECNSCGNTFSRDEGEGRGNTCPDCHKWASVQYEQACADCQDDELGKIAVIKCPSCEEWTTLEDASKIRIDPAKPKPFRPPWPKEQKFILIAPYDHKGTILDPKKKYHFGGHDDWLVYHYPNRERKTLDVGLNDHSVRKEGDHWANDWGESIGTPDMTIQEVQEHWRPVSDTEIQDFVASVNVCYRCGKKGTKFYYDLYRFLCTECLPKERAKCEALRVQS